jgi:hypothetical protein
MVALRFFREQLLDQRWLLFGGLFIIVLVRFASSPVVAGSSLPGVVGERLRAAGAMAARAWEEFTAAPYGPDSAPSREWRYEHQSLAWTCNGLQGGRCLRSSCEVDIAVEQTLGKGRLMPGCLNILVCR